MCKQSSLRSTHRRKTTNVENYRKAAKVSSKNVTKMQGYKAYVQTMLQAGAQPGACLHLSFCRNFNDISSRPPPPSGVL